MGKIALGVRVVEFSLGNITESRRYFGYKVFILIFTFFIYTCFHLSRKPISVVKSILYQSCDELSNTTSPMPIEHCGSWPPFDGPNHQELLGGLDLAFLFAYAVGMFFSGHIGERMNMRYFLALGMVLTGIFTCLFGLGFYLEIHHLFFYVAVQILAGFVNSTGWPCVVSCVANWYGKGNRGLIMGLWNSHTSVGNILGSVIAGAFVGYNWGLSFIVPGAIIGVFGIFVFFFLVPDPADIGCPAPKQNLVTDEQYENSDVDREPQPHQSDEPNEGNIQENDPLLRKESEVVPKPIRFRDAWLIPGVMEFSLCLFFAKLVSYTFLFWLPDYISHTGKFSPKIAADLSTLFDFGGIGGGILAGVVSDALHRRASTCFVMLLVACPMLFLYQYLGHYHLYLNIGLLLLVGAFVNGPYALITTAVSADLGTHKSLHGNSKALSTVTAIIDGTGSLGAALGPLLTGLISPTGWGNVFYMLIAANFCAMLLLSRLVLKENNLLSSSQRRVTL